MRDLNAIRGLLAGLAGGLVSGAILQEQWVLTPLPLMVGKPLGVMGGWLIRWYRVGLSYLIFGLVMGILYSVEPLHRVERRS